MRYDQYNTDLLRRKNAEARTKVVGYDPQDSAPTPRRGSLLDDPPPYGGAVAEAAFDDYEAELDRMAAEGDGRFTPAIYGPDE